MGGQLLGSFLGPGGGVGGIFLLGAGKGILVYF